ncbi:MAG: type II 3-dehydroquinate dehydratase [Bacteroidota bacterium]|nr:type II 3-dehydroquinate dehydratase [Bacteroidota bacterium]
MRILILNGPNLNLLGKREPDIYGNSNFQDFFENLNTMFNGLVYFGYRQSNVEGELIDILQSSEENYQAIIFNAGGYTHTSVALADCVAAIQVPVVEVHISQPAAREEYRHKSLIASKCMGSISGFGLDSYRLAVEALIEKMN